MTAGKCLLLYLGQQLTNFAPIWCSIFRTQHLRIFIMFLDVTLKPLLLFDMVLIFLGTHNLCGKDLTRLKPSILCAQVGCYIMYSKPSLYIYSMINDKSFACLCCLKFVFASTNASYGNCSMPFFCQVIFFFSLRWSSLCCRVQDMFINMFNMFQHSQKAHTQLGQMHLHT